MTMFQVGQRVRCVLPFAHKQSPVMGQEFTVEAVASEMKGILTPTGWWGWSHFEPVNDPSNIDEVAEHFAKY